MRSGTAALLLSSMSFVKSRTSGASSARWFDRGILLHDASLGDALLSSLLAERWATFTLL